MRQGDPQSLLIFNTLEMVFQELDWESLGLHVQGEFLSNLKFADDVAVFAPSTSELPRMLQDLDEHSGKVGLRIN